MRFVTGPFGVAVRGFVIARDLFRLGLIPIIKRRLNRPVSTQDLGAKLRVCLDSGGLVYRKLGQYLAMRSDLLPPEICRQLDALFDTVTPMPFAEVESILQAELGRPWAECFAAIDTETIGSASVAQVHRATALDGQRVAVKVQRKGIERTFSTDVRIFRVLARASDFLQLTGTLSMGEFFDEFARFTGQELDFELEARTASRLRNSVSAPGYVPAVRWDLTTRRLLTLEYVEGPSFLTLCRLSERGHFGELRKALQGLDLYRVVSHLADECFHQLFETGFFHGDPHPGNVILRSDGSFVFLDFGIFGELSPEHRRDFTGFVENLALARFTESAQYYTRMCRVTSSTQMSAWMSDVTAAIASWYAGLADSTSPIEQRHMGTLQWHIASAMRRHKVLARANQLLIWRALVLLDTTTLRLPIQFDVLDAMLSFFRRSRGNLGSVLRGASKNAILEAPGAVPVFISSMRLLLLDKSAYLLRAECKRRDADQPGGYSLSQLTLGLAGISCGALAFSGSGDVRSIGVIASAVLLALASQR